MTESLGRYVHYGTGGALIVHHVADLTVRLPGTNFAYSPPLYWAYDEDDDKLKEPFLVDIDKLGRCGFQKEDYREFNVTIRVTATSGAEAREAVVNCMDVHKANVVSVIRAT